MSHSLSLSLPGVGSLLSPSGDEDGISDQESPLSPLSAASSIGGSAEDVSNPEEEFSSPQGTDGETDYIEEDCPPSSPMHEPSAQALAIPPLRLPSSASSSSSSSSSSNTPRKRDLVSIDTCFVCDLSNMHWLLSYCVIIRGCMGVGIALGN